MWWGKTVTDLSGAKSAYQCSSVASLLRPTVGWPNLLLCISQQKETNRNSLWLQGIDSQGRNQTHATDTLAKTA